MPPIRRNALPESLMVHLSNRILERNVSLEDLRQLSKWLDNQPIAPEGRWFKRFESITLCGEGEWVKTVLTSSQAATGTEIK